MSDLCWTCQQNNSITLKTINRPTIEKSDVTYSLNFILCIHILQALKTTSHQFPWRGHFTRTSVKKATRTSRHPIHLITNFRLHHLGSSADHCCSQLQYTTVLIWPNRCLIYQLVLYAVCYAHAYVCAYSTVYVHTCSVVLCAHTCSAYCSVCKYM